MSKPLHIIWDLDGTLINSEKEVLEALKKSVRDAGLSEKEQTASFRIGPTIDKIVENAFSPAIVTSGLKQNIIENFRDNYDNCGFNNTLSFDGIEEILADENFMHHIVTNKPDLATNRIIEKLGWQNYFASVITPYSFIKSDADKRKSKAELFASCISDYPNETFVGIGDMDTDAKAAIVNKIPAIGVLWGTGTREELEKSGCLHIVKTVSNLKTLLRSF